MTSETVDPSEHEQAELARLRAQFPGHRIWRSTRYDGTPGDWVATLHDPYAGVDPHVIRSTAQALRDALRAQRDRLIARLGGAPTCPVPPPPWPATR